MGRRPTTWAMAVSRGAPHHFLLLCISLLLLTALCASLTYGSSSQALDKINLVDDSEVGPYQEGKVNGLRDSSLKSNEEINDSIVNAHRVARNSEKEDPKDKIKRKKKKEVKSTKEENNKKKIKPGKKESDKIKKKLVSKKKLKSNGNDLRKKKK